MSQLVTNARIFLSDLGWRDIFDLGGVWNRAVRIFTEPIDRLISLARSLVGGVIRFVKDAAAQVAAVRRFVQDFVSEVREEASLLH